MDFISYLINLSAINSEDIIKKLIPNFWSFLTQLLSLIVLLIVVIFAAYKPVKKMLKKRQDYIEENIKSSEDMKAESQIANREAKELVLASKRQAHEILEKATYEAEQNRLIAIEETNKEIIALKQTAQEDIQKAKEEAKEEIKKEIISVALLASKEVLQREITSEDNEKLVEKFIEDINK